MDAVSTRPERLSVEEAALYDLPVVTHEALIPSGSRAVVVAPHPDDEVLGAGGLLAQFCAQGCKALLIAVTDGTASHPGSALWPVGRLALIRPAETAYALSLLGVNAEVVRLGLPDGAIAAHADVLRQCLHEHLREGDVVITTWREDRHADHQAVGEVCAEVAAAHEVRLLETPIWSWDWLTADDAKRERAVRLPLPMPVRIRKLRAIHAFDSQIQPDESTGKPPILHPDALVPLLRAEEIFFT
ncbi:PIG-L deacetylase family protein [Uliginosibacterium sp. H1]|uniref:PIG-L deacetylase family protein n=1 Tax=Uliginosibacterium sp. H1 TaxID=3114757 RepID=UPI002E179B4D|nr:PIG-L family deacetylase [Uliginosibacterium sp. H1]